MALFGGPSKIPKKLQRPPPTKRFLLFCYNPFLSVTITVNWLTTFGNLRGIVFSLNSVTVSISLNKEKVNTHSYRLKGP